MITPTTWRVIYSRLCTLPVFQVCDCKGELLQEETTSLNCVGKTSSELQQENGERWWRQVMLAVRCYINLAAKHNPFINFLDICVTLCATFLNQKLWRGTLSLHKNHETKNSSGLQFKAYHQKRQVSCFGKTELI